MSVHVSPSLKGRSLPPRERQALPAALHFDGTAFPLPAEAFSSGGLAVRLPHMGVVIAIAASNGAAPAERDRANETAPEETIRFVVDEARFMTGSRGGGGAKDPVVQRLALALEAAEHSGDAFAGLYADALRLAVMARMLGDVTIEPTSIEPARLPPAADARPETRTPRAPRHTRSGLVTWRLKRVLAFIDAHLAEPVTLMAMAEAAGLSRMHFAAQFKVATGLRPHEFLLKRRIEQAQDLLRNTREPLVQIALAVGFQTQAHFTTVFRRFVGDTPYQWRCANAQRG
ncbi:AraC family transcriptional regulator [Xanthobacter autotrophicus]|uniref:helix-turn-helix domain-containing protein n=1 Tax=Xanthobacter autotrophicus TaxID=280 RepID=UPI003729DC16